MDSVLGLPLHIVSEDEHTYQVEAFQATPVNVNFLWEEAGKHDFLFSDATRGSPERFVRYLLSPGVFIFLVRDLELEDTDDNAVGILYADQLRPQVDARVHYLFWDKRHAGRQRLLLSMMNWFMRTFEVQRLNMEIPFFAFAALRRMHKMGIRVEGRRRDAIVNNGEPKDLLLFGITDKELNADVIEDAKLERTEQEADWFGLLTSDDILRVALAKEH